jgi:hypothetical protein
VASGGGGAGGDRADRQVLISACLGVVIFPPIFGVCALVEHRLLAEES